MLFHVAVGAAVPHILAYVVRRRRWSFSQRNLSRTADFSPRECCSLDSVASHRLQVTAVMKASSRGRSSAATEEPDSDCSDEIASSTSPLRPYSSPSECPASVAAGTRASSGPSPPPPAAVATPEPLPAKSYVQPAQLAHQDMNTTPSDSEASGISVQGHWVRFAGKEEPELQYNSFRNIHLKIVSQLGEGALGTASLAIVNAGTPDAYLVVAKDTVCIGGVVAESAQSEHDHLQALRASKYVVREYMADMVQGAHGPTWRSLQQYAPYGDLNEFISNVGPLDEASSRYLFAQALCGCKDMAAKHLVHADIKPANILLGQGMRLMLADLNLSQILDDDKQLLGDFPGGTPGYMAPELMAYLEYFMGPTPVKSQGGPLGIVVRAACRVLRFIGLGRRSKNSSSPTAGCGPDQHMAAATAADDVDVDDEDEEEDDATPPLPILTSAIDRYSLGLVLYNMLSGGLQPVSKDGRCCLGARQLSQLPAQAADLIVRLTAPDPAERLSLSGAMKHEWMRGVDWKAMKAGQLPKVPQQLRQAMQRRGAVHHGMA